MKAPKLFVETVTLAVVLSLSLSGTLWAQKKGRPLNEPPAEFRFPCVDIDKDCKSVLPSGPFLTGDGQELVDVNGLSTSYKTSESDGMKVVFWESGNPTVDFRNNTTRHLKLRLGDPPCLGLYPRPPGCDPCQGWVGTQTPFEVEAKGDHLWFFGLGTKADWQDPGFNLISGNLLGMEVGEAGVGYSMMPFRFLDPSKVPLDPNYYYLLNFGDREVNPDPGRSRVRVTRYENNIWHVEGIEDGQISTGRLTRHAPKVKNKPAVEENLGLCSAKVDFWIRILP